MQTINWTAGTGAKIEINFTAMFRLNRQGVRNTSGEMEVVVVAKVDGNEVQHRGLCPVKHPVAVAMVGPIGLTAENRYRYEAAYAAVETEIAAHNTACDAHEAKLNAVDAVSAVITKSMSHGE